jgi:hypothetical protein
MHNKEYALKLVQDKINGNNDFSYSQIGSLTGYTKLQIINFSKLLKEKDIDSILVHGLTNKPSNNSPSPQEIEFIRNFKNKYPLISITQFQDIYHEDIVFNPKKKNIVKQYNLKIRSYSFFETLYRTEGWESPIKHKCFNKEYEQHPLREPSPRRGILIMIDGTPHDWFCNGRKSSLHLAIDDATGEALCGWFMPTECLEGYVRMLEILVTKYGIPENIYCDRHTILINPKDGELTQFGKMCEDLGINIIAANTPQAKGKVEKWNNTIQNRLINDIKRYEIKSVEELNIFFNDYYCNYLNQKYAYEPKEEETSFVPLDDIDLSNILCIRYEREMLNGNVISYGNDYYQILDKDNSIKQIFKGTKLEVYQNVITNIVRVKYYNVFYETKKIEGHRQDPVKREQMRIDNQKQLEQVLKERDERLKARANKVSSS